MSPFESPKPFNLQVVYTRNGVITTQRFCREGTQLLFYCSISLPSRYLPSYLGTQVVCHRHCSNINGTCLKAIVISTISKNCKKWLRGTLAQIRVSFSQ